jgi:hypothetical protein
MHLIFSVNARLSPIYKLPTFPHFLFISFVHKDDMCNNLTSQLLPLVMLGASDGSQGHKPQSCSVRPLVVILLPGQQILTAIENASGDE